MVGVRSGDASRFIYIGEYIGSLRSVPRECLAGMRVGWAPKHGSLGACTFSEGGGGDLELEAQGCVPKFRRETGLISASREGGGILGYNCVFIRVTHIWGFISYWKVSTPTTACAKLFFPHWPGGQWALLI